MVNPRTLDSVGPRHWARVQDVLRQGSDWYEPIETRGDGFDRNLVSNLIVENDPDIVVAVGGDGTVNEVVQALMLFPVERRPALGILPFGTANNVARSLGLRTCRDGDTPSIDGALAALLRGRTRRIDLGRVGGHYFVGAAALGMDADILSTRNRMRQHRPRTASLWGGYGLYLYSCAVNLARPHGAPAKVSVGGAELSVWLYNLLLLNTALYAGEFRFAATEECDDGQLDLHLFAGAAEYVRGFVAAWRRHLRYQRAAAVEDSTGLRQVSQVRVELESPVACQLDGEEHGQSRCYDFRVVPGALAVCVPPARP